MRKIIVLLIFVTKVCFIQAEKQNLEQAKQKYDNNDYYGSVLIYNQLIKEGFIQYEIFYNIGNCYFKMDSIGKAILYFEKALKLNSNDKNIQQNLKLCNDLIINKQDYISILIIKNIKHKIINILPFKTWITTLIILLWILLTLIIINKKTQTLKIVIISLIVLSLFSIKQYSNDINKTEYGIITNISIDVKSSPNNDGNNIFTLHEGAKIKILQKNDIWSEISINNEIGWVKNQNYSKI